MRFTVIYHDFVFHGSSRDDWISAPQVDVQFVIEWTPYECQTLSPWAGVWDRRIWTGEDEYDPFGWGLKYGRLLPDHCYQKLSRMAFGDRDAIR